MFSFKKITAILGSALLVSTCFVFTAAAEGNGTANDPYLIANADDLTALMEKINSTTNEAWQTTAGEYYKVVNDIDLTGVDYVSGGKVENYVIKGFAGTFDGDNHTITGLAIDTTDKYTGLFGILYDGATVKNVNLKDVRITGSSYVGGIAGYAINSEIIGCHVEGIVSGAKYVGGIVGMTEARSDECAVEECSSKADVTASKASAGGIAGAASAFDGGVAFADCINEASVKAPSAAGGIVGDAEKIVVGTATEEGVEADADATVGIASCVNVGAVDGKTESGDIAGLVGVPYEIPAGTIVVKISDSYTVNEDGAVVPAQGVAGVSVVNSKAVSSIEEVVPGEGSKLVFTPEGGVATKLFLSYTNIYDVISHLANDEGFVSFDDFDKDGINTMADLNAMMRYVPLVD